MNDRPGTQALRLIEWLLQDNVRDLIEWDTLAAERFEVKAQATDEVVTKGRREEFPSCGSGLVEDLEYVRALLIVAQHHLPTVVRR